MDMLIGLFWQLFHSVYVYQNIKSRSFSLNMYTVYLSIEL